MGVKILLVEDDVYLQDGLCELLRKENYVVDAAGTYGDANRFCTENTYQLIILDITLPDGNGLKLCSHWRVQGKNTPVLFLTASDDEIQIVRGLDAGADDYVTKPFRLLELLSRIRALLRRNQPTLYNNDGLCIDLAKMAAFKNGKPIFLTPIEFQLLSALIKNSGKVLTRKILLQNIWDDAGMFIDDNTLSVHISRLREKIGEGYIKTIRGVGYEWEDAQ
ncbi:MAG: response regulator transcription factor [Bacillota bacterium]|nr:response regulator transcription factor [Bacillota bacterium]